MARSEHQGRGIGTAMRQVMCAFVFDHLDAVEITSGAFTDNPASLAVSRKVGYVENGSVRRERRPGEAATTVELLLTPEAFVRGEHAPRGERRGGVPALDRAGFGLTPAGLAESPLCPARPDPLIRTTQRPRVPDPVPTW